MSWWPQWNASRARQGDPDSAIDRLGDYLVAQGTLTTWQRDKLRNGQYKGFFLGQYKILAQDANHAAYRYLAEDLQSSCRVNLLIKSNRSLPGGLEYTAIEEPEKPISD